MNKSIVKIELIAEWIFLIIWMPILMLLIIPYLMVKPENFSQNLFILSNIHNAIVILLCIALSVNLIINIKNARKYLKQKSHDRENLKPPIHTNILLFVCTMFLTIYLIIIIPTLTFFGGFGSCDLTIAEEYPSNLLIIIFSYLSIYISINTFPSLRKLFNKEKLNILNIICLICSALATSIISLLMILNLFIK